MKNNVRMIARMTLTLTYFCKLFRAGKRWEQKNGAEKQNDTCRCAVELVVVPVMMFELRNKK